MVSNVIEGKFKNVQYCTVSEAPKVDGDQKKL